MSDDNPPEDFVSPAQEDVYEKPVSAGSNRKSLRPRAPSALTVENVRKHEEELDVVDVVELMVKNTEESVGSFKDLRKNDTVLSDSDERGDPEPSKPETFPDAQDITNIKQMTLGGDVWLQARKSTHEPISLREEVRGYKLSGEEYIAVSIDVQTDESFLEEYYDHATQRQIPTDYESYLVKSPLGLAASDGSACTQEKLRRKQMTSDMSSTEISKSGEEDVNHKTDISTGPESEVEEDNIITEMPDIELDISHFMHHSISKVGPPTILQYKTESSEPELTYDQRDINSPGNRLWDDLSSEKKDYYSNLMDEMRKFRNSKTESDNQESLISIEPGSSHASEARNQKVKEREKEKSKVKENKAQLRQGAGSSVGASSQMMGNQTNFYTFARQLKTVNYSLSSEKCMEEGWTIKPLSPEPTEEPPPEVFVYDPTKDVVSGKRLHQTFVQKFHPNGMQFLTVFPDGTGNVWYQSGNVAISIIATEKIGKMTFIIHDDMIPDDCYNIQAIFEPSGHCTCYYPSGRIRMLLTHIGGEYFNPEGDRVKKWQWRDQQTHVHAPPFQPITFSLNKNIGVRVLSQEVIYIAFTDGSRSIRFNAGTRLRFKPAAFLPKIQLLDPDLVFLHEKRLHIQSVVEKLNNSLRFPNSPRLKKLKLPSYLTAELDRSLKIRQQLLQQEQQAEKIIQWKGKTKKSASSKTSSVQILPKRRLKRLPYYPQAAKRNELEEVKPVVTVN